MKAYTLRLDDQRAKTLKHISVEEGRNMREILVGLLDRYIESHKETVEIMSCSGWVSSIKKAEEDMAHGDLISHKEVKKTLNVDS